MITRTSAFVTSDQQTFAQLDAAIGHELNLLFPAGEFHESVDGIVETILKNRDKIVDLLSTKERSRPRARKINKVAKKVTPPAVNRELQDQRQ